jgi:hypothetical protein
MSTPESNGRPPAADEAEALAEVDAMADDLGVHLDADDADDADDFDDGSFVPQVALTPRQILGGFVLLAALILLLRRRRRDT